MIKIWLAQFLLWLKYSWPLARDVLWPVLRDGRLEFEEVHDMLEAKWPVDSRGQRRTLTLPWVGLTAWLPGGKDGSSSDSSGV